MSDLGNHFIPNSSKGLTNPKMVFKGKTYRISILSDVLVRLEYDENGIFFDGLTELVENRNFPEFKFDVIEDANTLIVTTKYFRLQYLKEKPFLGSIFSPDSNLRINLLDTEKHWNYKDDEPRNIPLIKNALDTKKAYINQSKKVLMQEIGKNKSKMPKLFDRVKSLYSLDGYVSINDGENLIVDKDGHLQNPVTSRIDIYLFMYKRDFSECLKSYFMLTGNPPMVPRYSLGISWYKDEDYNFEDIKDLAFNFSKNGIPLHSIILGSNWHIKDNKNLKRYKSGFTFNQEKLGNSGNLSTYLHDRSIRLGLAIDPSEGIHPHEFKYRDFATKLGIKDSQDIPFNVFDKKLIESYLLNLITPLYNNSVDFFFIDYKTDDAKELNALNYYHFNDYKKFENIRGLILSRPADVAAHKYPIYFSGETVVSWDTLKKLPEYTSNYANIGLSWWSHDIGGFKDGIEDSELYLRYIQYGCFSPILRLASTYGHYYKREPWRWDVKTFNIVKDYLILRSRLIGYLYGEAYKYHKVGTPLIQPLYYQVPSIIDEVEFKNEYYFGTELLVAPITKKKDSVMQRAVERIYLPEGSWYDFKTGKKFVGNKRYVMFFKDEDYPVFAKSGSIIPMCDFQDNINVTSSPKSMEIHVFPGKSNIYNLYEDDGISSMYEKGYYIVTRFDYNYLQNNYTFIIRPFEGKSGIIPDKRDYRIRFRNTKNAEGVKVMLEANSFEFESYTEDNDFVVEVKDVPTIKQLTIICQGKDIEIDATRIVNEDIDSIISDLPILTSLKEEIGKIMFSDKDYSDKRIAIKKMNKKGLDDLFIRMFLKLLDYTKNI